MSVYFQNSAPPSRTNSFNDEKDNEQIMATACNGLGINKNSYASPTLHSLQLHNGATIAHPPIAADARKKKLEPLEMNPLQPKFIYDTMDELSSGNISRTQLSPVGRIHSMMKKTMNK